MIKNFNASKEKPINIKVVEKVGLVKEVSFIKKEIIVESNNLKTSFSLFALQMLKEKYGVNYDSILVVLYLHELGLFDLQVEVFNRTIRLSNYIILNLIEEEFLSKDRKLYRLTEKSNSIVREFNEILNDRSKFLNKNRSSEIDIDSQVSSALENYFKS